MMAQSLLSGTGELKLFCMPIVSWPTSRWDLPGNWVEIPRFGDGFFSVGLRTIFKKIIYYTGFPVDF